MVLCIYFRTFIGLPRAAVGAVADFYCHSVDLYCYDPTHDRNSFVNLRVTIELDVE